MAHAAIAYAKAHFRRRMMACTTSIGPGATNLITAAATAHVNRLPVLFLPGDVFVSRAPDPVLQQVEDFHDGGISANDCFKPVSRYFDRIVAPSQLLTALPRAIAVLTDPAQCGPVTLALPQDVQAQAYDYPEEFFAPTLVRIRAPLPEAVELDAAAQAAARGEAAGDRRRRRRALQRRRLPMRCAGSPKRIGVPVARNAGGKERAAVGPSAAGGPDRRDRRHGRQRARARRRCRDRGGHAAAGFHDGLAFAVSAGEARRDQRQCVRRAEVARDRRAGRRRDDARRAVGAPRRLDERRGVAGQGDAAKGEAWRDTVSAIVGRARISRRPRCRTTAR